MCEESYPKKLPLLPGYSFRDVAKVAHHKSQCFDYKLGVPDFKVYLPGPGNSPRDIDSMGHYDWDSRYIRLDPKFTYGPPRVKNIRPFKPHYVTHDRSCLRFKGYFRQDAFNTPDESQRIRVVDILYFLEDDTVTVIEPLIPNSGLPQGRLVRRSRIPRSPPPDCQYLHWKDLNLGQEVRICGFLIRLVDCDPYTKEFLCSQGIILNSPEEIPWDDFTRRKEQQLTSYQVRHNTANPELKLRQFLMFDKMILKFRAIWSEEGDTNAYCIAYFLEDDTIQISEIHEKNNGKDPFPILLKRTKLPKHWDKVEMTYPSLIEEAAKEVTEFYKPKDLIVGQTISVYGRSMFIHMCDQYTRNYYKQALNITQPDNIDVKPPPVEKTRHPLPPYTGFGELEDSMQSCLTFKMKSPRKDIVRKIVNANHFLRYEAQLCSTLPEDQDREFILSYSLADGTISITEPPKKNTGHMGGRFLSKMRVPKPGSSPDFPEYYTPHDFAIGNIVTINDFRFKITGADLHVYNYMKDNPEKFRQEVVESVRNYMLAIGAISSE